MYKRVHVIINPASGRDRPILSMLNGIFQDAGIDWDISLTKPDRGPAELARKALETGIDALAVYGGDGTITEAASGLAGSDVPLAILPGGTANAIAQALGIPLDPAAACALLVDAPCTVKTTDLGEIGDKHFLIAIGIGIPGALAEAADREAKDRMGVLAYAFGSFQALRNAQSAQYDLTIDGEQISRQAVMAVIANSGNFGVPGLSMAGDIDMNDGKLDVLVFENTDLSTLISTAASAVRQDDQSPAYERWRATEVAIRTSPAQAIQADGEVLEPGEIVARLHKGAVKFLVPAAAAKP